MADVTDALSLAIAQLAGAALVLDEELRTVAATPAAEALLGFPVPLGKSAPKLLAGNGPKVLAENGSKRAVTEALEAGRPFHLDLAGERRLSLRPMSLGSAGYLVFIEPAGPANEAGTVLFHGMWTQDAALKQVFRIVERVAPEDVSVLVRGETGAGKELVAHALHALSARKDGPFRAINCAALPPNLLESELFGHARGAFTGAVKDTVGHFQTAHGGTLFLDEVAELPLELQAKLLRVVETRTVLPVGAREAVPVDVRIVSATHRSLRQETEAGRFRADLMFRLRVVPIVVPPLRERPGDVAVLVRACIDEMNRKNRRRIETVSPAALELLTRYDYPGNVRELRNFMAYAYAIGTGPVLLPADLPPEIADPRLGDRGRPVPPAPTRAPSLPGEPQGAASPEAQRILAALDRAGGNKARAAEILGISRITLWRRMTLMGLSE